MFSGKVAKKIARSISRQEALSRPSRRAASPPLSLAALCARQKPLYPRRVYRHERDGGDHRFSRYSESGEISEAANRTEIV